MNVFGIISDFFTTVLKFLGDNFFLLMAIIFGIGMLYDMVYSAFIGDSIEKRKARKGRQQVPSREGFTRRLLREFRNFERAMWREKDIKWITISGVTTVILGYYVLGYLSVDTTRILIFIGIVLAMTYILLAIRFEKKSVDFTKSYMYKYYWFYSSLRCLWLIFFCWVMRSL